MLGPSLNGRARWDGSTGRLRSSPEARAGWGWSLRSCSRARGAKIVLTDVADDAGEAVAAEIEAAGGQALYVHSDVSDEADAEAMVKAAVDRFGGLSVLYNNAGVMMSQDGSVTETDVSIWDTTLGINVKGVAFGCKYGVPAMIASGGGSIINVASFVAWMGAATSQTAYTASKGAVVSMTREIAVEFARRGIRATRCAPGRSTPRCSPSCSPIPRGASGDSCTSRWAGSGRRTSSRRRPCSSRATTRRS